MKEEGIQLETIEADLRDFDLGLNKWDGIVSIFGHLQSELRKNVHEKILRSLKPGGFFLLKPTHRSNFF